MAIDYRNIGLIGFVNLLVLAVIVLWRTFRWYSQWEGPHTFESYAFRKKFAFHFFLFCATISDIPLYISFYVVQEYALVTYSFHKFSSAYLFAALSLTISDWAAVLHDIHEYKHYPWVFGKVGLFTVNGVYFCISFVNFVLCYVSDSVEDYTRSPLYYATIFLQISISILLTCLMLHAGLKLYNRIQGAAGSLEQHRSGRRSRRLNSQNGGTYSSAPGSTSAATAATAASSNQFANQFDGSAEFRSALRNLILVMFTCTMCIFMQMLMMVLNFAWGYADSTTRTVGPALLYWTLMYWIPTWGPVLSLLYLCRTHNNRKKARFNTMRLHSHDINATAMHSPLIDSADLSMSGGLLTSDDHMQGLRHQSGSANTTQGVNTSSNVLQAILSGVYNRESNQGSNRTSATGNNQRPSNPSRFESNRAMGRRSFEDDDSVTETGSRSSHHTLRDDVDASNISIGDYLLSPDQSMLHNLYIHSYAQSPPHPSNMHQAGSDSNLVTPGVMYEEPADDIRETTMTLPSELYFPNFRTGHNLDFSYRGGDDHNGHFG